ncbi:MAG: serine/threonine protein kinase [Deltaproteobacteria bacterium]|nr:serine/threonine protein kinase [Deltaproteobacteria bacterium]MBK8713269.1 serine/threonine protein kinase [Deltaproteobacteria bacterium]MBP7288946.1 serine/threonine protein kinase [Nannocystaceae bacterium]
MDDDTVSKQGGGSTDPVARMFADEDLGGASEVRAAARLRQALLGTIDPSSKLARYRLIDVLGRGAMGEVWIAEDPELARRVAIKLVRPGMGGDARYGERLAREARALAALSHPNVVQVFDAGVHDDERTRTRSVFIVMELVDGETLAQWLSRRPEVPDIVAVFVQAAAGLAAAHAVGLVHRDFKPANVFIGRDGRARVGDFGLAREATTRAPEQVDVREALELIATDAAPLTRSGAVVGTPLYMAPEQHRGDATDARSDQYAFCVALYEALFRVRPFAGNLVDVVAAKTAQQLVDNPRAAVSDALTAVVMRGLSPDPGARWPTMDQLAHALVRALRPRWRRPVLVGGVVLGLAAAYAGASATGESCPGLQRAAVSWSPAVRSELERVLVETDGIVRHDLLLHAIDVQAERLHRAQGQLCQLATPDPGVVACVAGAQAEFEALLEVFSHGTPSLMVRATLQVSELPDPLDCATAAEPGRVQPEQAAALTDAREALARARVRMGAGLDAEAAMLATDAIARAEAVGIGYDSTLGELRLLAAMAQDELGMGALVAATLERAYFDAVAADDTSVALRAAARITINAAEANDVVGAQRWLRHTEAEHAKAGATAYDEGTYWQSLGVVRGYAGDLAAASDAFRRTAAVCDDGACPSLHAAAVDNLAESALALGDADAAVALREKVVAEVAERNGDDAVLTSFARLSLAEALWLAGRSDEARAAIDRARAVIERYEGPNHPSLANAALVTAGIAIDAGDYAVAVVAARDAVARIEAITSPDSPRRAAYHGTLASALEGAGDHAEALRIYDGAMVGADQASVIERGPLLVGRARARLSAGDPTGAIADARSLRALELGTPYEVADQVVATFVTEARARLQQDGKAAALELIDEGLAWADGGAHDEAAATLRSLRAELVGEPRPDGDPR